MNYDDSNRFSFGQPEEEPPAFIDIPPAPEKKKKGSATKIIAGCLACALVGGIAGGSGVLWATQSQLAQQNTTASEETNEDASTDSVTLYEGVYSTNSIDTAYVDGDTILNPEQIYEANINAVVGISGNVTTNIWGQTVQNATSGSGFVISSDGYILTNYHVIDGVEDIVVSFADGSSYDAVLLGGEEDNDIAVIKIEAEGLQAVVLGDSSELSVGEPVVAIGNPLGELTFSLTVGYVSALDRAIAVDDSTIINMFQTDAAVNSGNSGGPMFDQYGRVVGIVSAKYSSSTSSSSASVEGLGFVIPVNDVMDMVTSIIEYGYVTGKPSVGIYMNDVDSSVTQKFGIPGGAYVEAILEGSCADIAGLEVGDVITVVNQTAVSSSSQLQTAVAQYNAGDSVEFTVYRNGETLTLTVVLDESNQTRTDEMTELYNDILEEATTTTTQDQTQSQDQSQSQDSYSYSWPFSTP